ncbi:MAG: hypothetical protein IT219_02910 [Bacteroidales bacterium]|nr:hypothetical protein [Bacteroidales bacterium]
MSAETDETYHCEVTVPEFFNRTYQKIIDGFQLTFIHVVHIFRPSKDQLMKTSRFFNSFLPAIVQLSVLELTRMISLLFDPQKGGFIPPQQWQVGSARAEGFIIGFCHELYCTPLFDNQFVPYCTTKYIFWLGKNKFDRGCRFA